MSVDGAEPQGVRTGGRWANRIIAGVLAVVGLTLLAGGVVLVVDGGSPYYAITGLAVTISGVLLWRQDPRGKLLYAAMLVWTVAWAIWEVGCDGWALAPRIISPFVLGLALLIPSIRRSAALANGWRKFGAGLAGAILLGLIAHHFAPADPAIPYLRTGTQDSAPGRLASPLAKIDRDDWAAYGNDQGGTRFSPLDQINLSNVGKLTKVWEADMVPTAKGPPNGLEVTPIMVGGMLYTCDGFNGIHAFDAETGRPVWRRNISNGEAPSGKPCRGVAYYKVPGASGDCAERIFAPSHNPSLVALDAHTGAFCSGFGVNGSVDLREGIGKHPHGLFYVSSAPQIIRGKVVVGGGIPDGQYWNGPSGVIRAYDAITGKLAWAFDAGQPDRSGMPQPGQVYTPSSPNSWGPISADETLGLVYMPMGNSTPDTFGGQRRPFDEALSAAVIALDAETGKLRWRFQATHHDIWDYDVGSQPTLVDWPTPQGSRPALIQPTKNGDIYVLDRRTGVPILPVKEVSVAQGGIARDERLSKTQPSSVALPAFRGPDLREKDMWGMTPIDQLWCRVQFRESRYEGMYTPITLDKPVLVYPGSMGGIDWNSVSLDVDRGIMIVNWTHMADRITLVTRAEADRRKFALSAGLDAGGQAERPMFGTPYGAYGVNFLSPLGLPCNRPPWGLVAGVDLMTGKVIWSHPLGTPRDVGPMDMPTMLPLEIGTPTAGGSVTTRGGLVFIGGAAEHTFRALDSATGKQVWSARLPTSANATPMTYRSPKSGRQFVVVVAGGRPHYRTKPGTKMIAYALPPQSNN